MFLRTSLVLHVLLFCFFNIPEGVRCIIEPQDAVRSPGQLATFILVPRISRKISPKNVVMFNGWRVGKMLHGAGIFTYILVIFGVNVAKYSSTMEHLGLDISMD